MKGKKVQVSFYHDLDAVMGDHTRQPDMPHQGNCEIELPKYRRPGEPEKYRLSAAARLRASKAEQPLATPIVCDHNSHLRSLRILDTHTANKHKILALLVQNSLRLRPSLPACPRLSSSPPHTHSIFDCGVAD